MYAFQAAATTSDYHNLLGLPGEERTVCLKTNVATMHSASGKSLINTATTVTTTTALDKFDRFEAWLRANGARFEQVRYLRDVCVCVACDLTDWGCGVLCC